MFIGWEEDMRCKAKCGVLCGEAEIEGCDVPKSGERDRWIKCDKGREKGFQKHETDLLLRLLIQMEVLLSHVEVKIEFLRR